MGKPVRDVCVGDLLIRAVRLHGDRVAINCDGRTTTYDELDDQSDRLAGFLAARGAGAESVVAIHLPNCAEYLVADLAILKLGGIKVPLSDMMSTDEVQHCLTHSGAQALITDCPRSSDTPLIQIVIGDSNVRDDTTAWRDAVQANRIAALHEAGADDAAVIIYTGGTTGRPKGILHRAGPLSRCLLSHVINGEISSDEVMLLTTPLPHSAGWFAQAGLFQGARIELLSRFDARSFIDTVCDRDVTWTFAVPTMLYRVLAEVAGNGTQTPFRTIIYGAAPMDPARLREARDIFGNVFIQLYGQSECPNFITRLTKDDHAWPDRLRSCGRPVTFARLRIGDNAEVAPGEVGEVNVSCSYTMDGYFNADPEVEDPFLGEWMRTGDLGYVDEGGYLYLVDRAKDMIISGGMNVYCAEVENALRRDPGVDDAAVIGVPDADWGERVVAFVVGSSDLDKSSLLRAARERLAAYKLPKDVYFIKSLPTTRFGKIDKKQLRAAILETR